MKISLPDDCGNAPRIGITNDIVAAWARGDREVLDEWSAEDIEWEWAGSDDPVPVEGEPGLFPGVVPDVLTIENTISHGKFASSHGSFVQENWVTDFALFFRFKSAGKQAKVASVKGFLGN